MKALRKRFENLSTRDQRAVKWGGLALAIALIINFLIAPWLGHWADSRDRIQGSQAELSRLRVAAAGVLSQRSRVIDRFGPGAVSPLEDAQTATIKFLKAAPDVLKGGGVQIQNIQQQPAKQLKDLPGVDSLPFQVEATCELPQLAQCLDAMRKSENLIIVEQINVDADGKDPGRLKVTFVLATLARHGRAAK